MATTIGPVQWRAALRQLFADAGYEKEELLRLVDAYEELAADYAALLADNERLKLEVRKAREDAAAGSGASYMSSKLWDAIHE
jgi:cell division septum initiation protein DivIVA